MIQTQRGNTGLMSNTEWLGMTKQANKNISFLVFVIIIIIILIKERIQP